MEYIEKINELYNFKVKKIKKNEESSAGNVYNIEAADNKRYILKIYNSLEHANNMEIIHEKLKENDICAPNIIRTKDNNFYFKTEQNNYGVIYSYVDGVQFSKIVKSNKLDEKIIKNIAQTVRKMHNTLCEDVETLPELEFANKLSRKSVLHFDLTKDNIFVNGDKIIIIDFDDAKYGDSICDVAILISLLFVSKKNGVNQNNIDIFLDEYYRGDSENKEKEVPLIKTYIKEWVEYLLKNNNFDSSLKESFEYKRDAWKYVENNTLETSLGILRKDDKLLLGMKKRGFGAGKYNGIGGKIELGETPEQAMIRETQEEIGVKPINYEKMAVLDFDEYYKGEKQHVKMYVYLVYEWEGTPVESEEMSPEWFNINEIPYNQMLPDDKYWLPKVLAGTKVEAYFNFDEEWDLISKELLCYEKGQEFLLQTCCSRIYRNEVWSKSKRYKN